MCLDCIDDIWKIFKKHTIETLILEKKIKELKKDLEEKYAIIGKGQTEFMNKVHPENGVSTAFVQSSDGNYYRDEEKIKEWIKEIKLKYPTDFKVPRIKK